MYVSFGLPNSNVVNNNVINYPVTAMAAPSPFPLNQSVALPPMNGYLPQASLYQGGALPPMNVNPPQVLVYQEGGVPPINVNPPQVLVYPGGVLPPMNPNPQQVLVYPGGVLPPMNGYLPQASLYQGGALPLMTVNQPQVSVNQPLGYESGFLAGFQAACQQGALLPIPDNEPQVPEYEEEAALPQIPDNQPQAGLLPMPVNQRQGGGLLPMPSNQRKGTGLLPMPGNQRQIPVEERNNSIEILQSQNANAWQDRLQKVGELMTQRGVEPQQVHQRRKIIEDIELLWTKLQAQEHKIFRLIEEKNSKLEKLSTAFYSSSSPRSTEDTIIYYSQRKKIIELQNKMIRTCESKKGCLRRDLDRLLDSEIKGRVFDRQDKKKYEEASKRVFLRRQELQTSLGKIESPLWKEMRQKFSSAKNDSLVKVAFACGLKEKQFQIWKEIDQCWDHAIQLKYRMSKGLPFPSSIEVADDEKKE